MIPVGPFVEPIGPRLNPFPIFDWRLRIEEKCHTAWGENARDLLTCHLALATCHCQIHQVVCVGKVYPVKRVDRHVAAQPQRSDVCTGGFNVSCVDIKTVDEIAVTCSQSGGEFAVPTTDVHDQPTLHAGRVEDFPNKLAVVGISDAYDHRDRCTNKSDPDKSIAYESCSHYRCLLVFGRVDC